MSSERRDETTDQDPDRMLMQMIEQARSGDAEAMEEIMGEIRNYLLLIANNELDQNLQGKLGASDVVQQTLLGAHNKLQQFRGSTKQQFFGWVRQILLNDLYDARRKFTTKQRQVGREQGIDDSQHVNPQLADQLLTPSSEAMQNEQSRLIHEMIEALPDRDRAVIKLRNWQELSFAQISEELGCTEEAARKIWYRAIVRLQEEMRRQLPNLKASSIFDPR